MTEDNSYSIVEVADLPKETMVGTVYVTDFCATFLCPCGCGDRIFLNLSTGATPLWTVNGNSISPSVNRMVGCRSHFFITNGKPVFA